MTKLKFYCPHCGQHIEADEGYCGQNIPCPTCNIEFIVPTQSSENELQKELFNKQRTKTQGTFKLNNRPCNSFDEIKKELKLCQRLIIDHVTLSNGDNNFLCVIRNNKQYQLKWIVNGEVAESISTSLTFKKVIELFQAYYSNENSHRKTIRWEFPAKKSNQRAFKDSNDALISKPIAQKTEKNLPTTTISQYKKKDFQNLGYGELLGGIVSILLTLILVVPLLILILAVPSCNDKSSSSNAGAYAKSPPARVPTFNNKNSSSSTNSSVQESYPSSWKQSNDPLAWRAEEEKLENQSRLKNAPYSCRRCGMKSYNPLNDGVNGIDGVCAYCVDYLRSKR